MQAPIVSNDSQKNNIDWHSRKNLQSADAISNLLSQGFNYPEMFEMEKLELLEVLKSLERISFNSSHLISHVSKERGSGYIINIAHSAGEKEEMKISLIHEAIHVHLELFHGLRVGGIHWLLEEEIEVAAVNFIAQNKTFCEILFDNLNLYCQVEILNNPETLIYWEELPEFLEKYVKES